MPALMEELEFDLERELQRSVYRDSFYEYIKAAWSGIESAPFVDSWHIGAVAEHLQAVSTGQITDLLINVPPGCSKSLLTCVFWPSWEWIKNASIRWFFSSYDQQLSTRDSVKCRNLLSSAWYQSYWPNQAAIRRDQDQKTYYETLAGGYRLATSIGGHGTGEHPDRIVVDDPHNVRKAESETDRQNVIDWWDLTMPTRGLSRKARRVIIMQRLHHRDLSGHILSKGGFVHLCLPMRYEPNRMILTPLGWNDPRTEEGTLLAPGQFPEEAVAKLEKSLGTYGSAGQLQQRPQPRSGGLFKPHYFNRRAKAAPREAIRIRAWDRAATCLVAGTLVETSTGPRPIEQILPGELVLTRQGYKEVLWSGQSGTVDELTTVQFDNGACLMGTADHKVWTIEGGWVDLSTVGGSGYTVVALNGERSCRKKHQQEPNRSCFEELSTGVGRGDGTTRYGGGTRKPTTGGPIPCIVPFGDRFMGKFPRDMTFITATAIGTTTTSVISNVCLGKNTTSVTELLLSGIRPTLQRNITSESGRSGRRPRSTEPSPVCGVVMNLNQDTLTQNESSSVPSGVAHITESTPRSKPASYAKPCSWVVRDPHAVLLNVQTRNETSIVSSAGSRSRKRCESRNHVVERAEGFDAGRSGVPVYDLTVKDAHEFFANGILVHNSQGGCYTAGVLMAKAPDGTLYVEDCVHGQWEPNERNDRIIATAKQDRLRYGPRHEPTIYIESERGSTGLESFQRLAARLIGHRVKEDRPTGSKDVRAEPWSDQLAALNVVICDGGQQEGTGKATWDVDGYIQEHLLFKVDAAVKRLGAFKDQVDASSMCCNLLSNMTSIPEVRVLRFRTGDKIKHPRLVVCPRHLLHALEADVRAVLIQFADPFTEPVPVTIEEVPIQNLLDRTIVQFADIDPANHQETWEQPIPPYNRPAAELIMTRDHGKAIWRFLTKDRGAAPDLYVLVEETGNRSDAVAKAIVDVGRIPRSAIYYADPDNVEGQEKQPPQNSHVFEVMKSARGAVI